LVEHHKSAHHVAPRRGAILFFPHSKNSTDVFMQFCFEFRTDKSHAIADGKNQLDVSLCKLIRHDNLLRIFSVSLKQYGASPKRNDFLGRLLTTNIAHLRWAFFSNTLKLYNIYRQVYIHHLPRRGIMLVATTNLQTTMHLREVRYCFKNNSDTIAPR
jgi:hypothetical protein